MTHHLTLIFFKWFKGIVVRVNLTNEFPVDSLADGGDESQEVMPKEKTMIASSFMAFRAVEVVRAKNLKL